MANRALEGAQRKGREARDRGEPRTACPYRDHRKDTGRLTFSRAFINAWHHGWFDRDRELALADDVRQAKANGGQYPDCQPGSAEAVMTGGVA